MKVDVQSCVGPLGPSFGISSTEMTRAYHRALEASIEKYFDSNCISCMCHSSENLMSLHRTPICRVSDDFYPEEDASHGAHVMSVAYNSVFLGELAIPDYDMFWSSHEHGALHAACRVVGGCPIYVSDIPGKHNFQLLRSLVLSDGFILRAKLPGRPTRDCLFKNVIGDGETVLKIWNWNEMGGLLGCFNVQGAEWSRSKEKFVERSGSAQKELTYSVSPRDAELFDGSKFAMYSYR